MQLKRITLALATAGACLPPLSATAADYSPEWWMRSVGQVCQKWSDGVTRCMSVPVAVPAPGPYVGKTLDPLMPVKPAPVVPQSAPLAAAPVPPLALPKLPTLPLPGFNPATNPYLAHTPYAQQNASAPTQLASRPATKPEASVVAKQPEPATVAQAEPAASASTAPLPSTPVAPTTMPALALTSGQNATPAPTPAPTTGPVLATSTQSPARPEPVKSAPDQALARPEDILAHFEFDKAELTDIDRSALDAWFGRLPAGLRVRVTGHADRFGPNRYNLALSRRRAESVMRYLADKGMKANDIVIQAKGENLPLVHCKGSLSADTKACLAPNRRVEIGTEAGPG